MADAGDAAEKTAILHERYRGHGTALMTTVITLSTALLMGLRTISSAGHTPVFFGLFLPISLALGQQLANYLGHMYEARGHYATLVGNMLFKSRQKAREAGISDQAAFFGPSRGRSRSMPRGISE